MCRLGARRESAQAGLGNPMRVPEPLAIEPGFEAS
jgi:hypothetical protein